MLMEQERRVTRRNGFSVPLPPVVRRIIAPFAAFSEFLPIDPRQWMERATDSLGLLGELLGGREDSASGVRRSRIPSGKSQRKKFLRSLFKV